MTDERTRMCSIWRIKLNAAYEDYKSARDFRQSIQDEMTHMPQSDGGFAFRRASIEETSSQREYREVLRIYTDIAVHGRRPPQ